MRFTRFLLLLTVTVVLPAARGADEPGSKIEGLRKQLDDPRTAEAARERIVVDLATALDQSAQNAATGEASRARWTEASAVLDEYLANHAATPRARTYEVQSAVYLWARARSWMQTAKVNPADREARVKAFDDLTECTKRLGRIADGLGNAQDSFAQNVRFRTAQALADMAEVGPDDTHTRQNTNTKALDVLGDGVNEPGLAAYAKLLRGSLLGRLRRFDEAETALDAAAKGNPPAPAADVLDARLTVAIGKEDYKGAYSLIQDSKVDAVAKAAARIRVRLEQRTARLRGPEREAAEVELFEDLVPLRGSNRADARSALVAVARTVREPAGTLEPDAWDALAEGAVALGDLPRAGHLERQAADRAESQSLHDKAVAYRLRGGAYYFQAERFADADAILSRVAEDPKAGASRAKGSLLRALARGRALALDRPGSSAGAYADALDYHIKTFDNDPSTAEARWLLGQLRLAAGREADAIALWTAIPHGGPRWLPSRLEIAAVQRRDLNLLRLNHDRAAIEKQLRAAREFLTAALGQCDGAIEQNEILMAQLRLDLTPGIGRPEDAHKVWEKLQRSAAKPEQREEARRLDLVALAQMNRVTEAERALHDMGTLSDLPAWLEIARLLDHTAGEAESDARVRRCGLLLRTVMSKVLERPDALSPLARDEARLRQARAMLLSGDDAGARAAMTGWRLPAKLTDDDILRDLADAYVRLEAFGLAVDVERLRARKLATGSLPWFDARYGLALAYYRSGKADDAYHLIDATLILHPDLGGGELKEKFLKLKQRVEPRN